MRLLITGGGRGIGLGIARVCLAAGHDALIVGRDHGTLAAAAEALAATPGRLATAVADVSRPEQIQAAVRDGTERLGALDAAVINAGVSIRKPVTELTAEEWHRMIATNLDGAFHTVQAVLPGLRARGAGHLVFISSISGRLPLAPGSGYAASKWGVSGFAESLHGELRDEGIKVTLVYPGSVATGLHADAEEREWMLAPEDIGTAVRGALETPANTLVHRVEVRPLRRRR